MKSDALFLAIGEFGPFQFLLTPLKQELLDNQVSLTTRYFTKLQIKIVSFRLPYLTNETEKGIGLLNYT